MRLQMCTKIAVFALAIASVCGAQNAAPPQADGQKPADQTPAPPAPAALPTPAITGPLSGLPPAMFDAGPFGKIAVNGILNGFGIIAYVRTRGRLLSVHVRQQNAGD